MIGLYFFILDDECERRVLNQSKNPKLMPVVKIKDKALVDNFFIIGLF